MAAWQASKICWNHPKAGSAGKRAGVAYSVASTALLENTEILAYACRTMQRPKIRRCRLMFLTLDLFLDTVGDPLRVKGSTLARRQQHAEPARTTRVSSNERIMQKASP